MQPWDNGILRVNGRYLYNGDTPFFWLGDTAWLMFTNLDEKETYTYLKNRTEKGYNVIQCVLVYSVDKMNDINKMAISCTDVRSMEYWEKCDRIIAMAEELGMYTALLPSWGSLVKKGIINPDNASEYAEFLSKRYGDKKNIIWLLGGDIKAKGYEEIYNTIAAVLKKRNPHQLIGFHPFGRCSSTMWFKDADWLDFNMFQSGHRRYDQRTLNEWDDNGKDEFFGEDSWKYVKRDYLVSDKPTLDGEPSYEWILQGLHDPSQPYWTAKDVRRYAYWSVFAGACGHTYGDNSVMQFYSGNTEGRSYGAKDYWKKAIHHDGSAQVGYLKKLMESVDFVNGREREDLLIGGQREKYERIAVFGGEDYLLAYNYSGREFAIDLSQYCGGEIWYFKPATGSYSYIGAVEEQEYRYVPPAEYDESTDFVLVVRR